MSNFADSPFQMDEELDPEPEPSLSPQIYEKNGQYAPINNTSLSENTLDGISHLRSRLTSIKMEEGTGTTTEEDEMTFEEDLDDKFDGGDVDSKPKPSGGSDMNNEDNSVTPPENFAPVINKIYRSSFPQTQNFTFLKKLGLTSVLCLIPEEYPKEQQEFFEKEGIRLFQLGMSGNKEPFVKISGELITKAIKIVIDPVNQPILIHCNRGKHRTGCLVGVLRRLQGWSLTIIFDEYRKFAAPKERPMDQQFIELYDESAILEYAKENQFLPMAWS